ncbi:MULTISPECIES: enoyl-CoA hydratase/isomerase family protein [Micrococcaceae]|uniref:enoyl-CoA hydratase/isomerase family protein n=1 Tax=Micrococcaceae TaxID=1268 RepID=UPI0017F7A9F6|nr:MULTISPECIES: enoyl-CoA hydratase-related protein [Micrococcaceae]MBB5747738.1 enoyl-CoA hydratase/carnithine racemase [Micrococcus sp. TA1]HRO31356.1 enoyl-CoA hydratase-related protein [Citricoccus sp.]HRO95275.1 enoyl-CoA hydratase-related protein [Citricoccus sp.]
MTHQQTQPQADIAVSSESLPEAFETILAEVSGAVGTITINRPDKRNALSRTVLAEIGRVLDAWEEDDDVSAVIFTGAGEKAFIAGADISQLAHYDLPYGLAAHMQRLYDRIQDYPKPTLAALNGVAMGGGLELAMSCDIRIAAEHARMGLPETTLGVLPGAGGTQRLSRLVGTGRAVEMILTSRILTAAEAERYGLVTTVVPAAELLPTAAATVGTILTKGPLAIRLAKMVIGQGAETDQRTGLLLERLAQTLLYTTEDKAEGATAFLDKRTPEFRGR